MRFYAGMIVAVLAASPVLAAEKLFDVVRKDGTVISVTDADLRQIGETTIRVPLGKLLQDGKTLHNATGPLFREFLAHFSLEGSTVDAIALDAYQIDIPVSDTKEYDVILATHIDGKKLSVRDRGPVWVLYPTNHHPELQTPVYGNRAIWQVKEMRMR